MYRVTMKVNTALKYVKVMFWLRCLRYCAKGRRSWVITGATHCLCLLHCFTVDLAWESFCPCYLAICIIFDHSLFGIFLRRCAGNNFVGCKISPLSVCSTYEIARAYMLLRIVFTATCSARLQGNGYA